MRQRDVPRLSPAADIRVMIAMLRHVPDAPPQLQLQLDAHRPLPSLRLSRADGRQISNTVIHAGQKAHSLICGLRERADCIRQNCGRVVEACRFGSHVPRSLFGIRTRRGRAPAFNQTIT